MSNQPKRGFIDTAVTSTVMTICYFGMFLFYMFTPMKDLLPRDRRVK